MTAPASSLKLPALHRFDDVIGQKSTIARLQKRLRADHNATGVILFGPAGVGKRSMARLYAAALLCREVAPDDAPCGRCESCQDVRLERGWNFIAVDPHKQLNRADDEGLGGTQGIRKWAQAATLDGRPRVMEVANADKIVGDDFDALLKTLESAQTPTVFVFLATRLKDVRLAGQSRCMAFRLRRLSPDELRLFALRLCADNGIACPEQVLTAVVNMSEGLPGRLVTLIKRMHGLGELSLEGLKVAAEIEWLDVVADRWRELLMKGACTAGALLAATPGSMAERVARAQQVMRELIALSALGPAEEAAAGDPLASLFNAFSDFAGHRGRRPDELLQALASELLAGV